MARNIYLILLLACVAVLSACTEKSEKTIDPHKGLVFPEKKMASKETLRLFKSIEENNNEYVKDYLTKNRIDFSEQNKDGDTLLIYASGKGRKEATKILLNAGAPVNEYGGQGDNALLRAAAEDKPEVVAILLDAKADINSKGREAFLGATPLFLASSVGADKIVKLLLEKGADVDLANKKGVTPLMDAAYGSPRMVKILLQYNANPMLRDENGNSALRIARQSGQPEILNLLKHARENYIRKQKNPESKKPDKK